MSDRPDALERISHEDFLAIVDDLPAFWGSDRTRSYHHPMFVHEFGDTARLLRPRGEIEAYIFGFMSQTEPTGYVHLIGVRDRSKGKGIGRGLYGWFEDEARRRGCDRIKAVTSPLNEASIAFHRALGFQLLGESDGFAVPVVKDYAGRGEDIVVFVKSLTR